MRKGPMARGGALLRIWEIHVAGTEKKGNMERGSWKGGQRPGQEDFRILIFTLKSRKKHLRVQSKRD